MSPKRRKKVKKETFDAEPQFLDNSLSLEKEKEKKRLRLNRTIDCLWATSVSI